MNTLAYAILGLIDKDKVTGYDLTKIFNDSVADFWSAKQSQIYTELKKLVDAALIEYEVVIQGEVLEKKVYSITTKGKEELAAWMHEDEPPLSQSKDIFKLRLYFSEQLTSQELCGKFEKQLEKCQLLLTRYTIKFNEYDSSDIPTAKIGDYLLLNGAIAHLRTQIEWLNESLAYIQK